MTITVAVNGAKGRMGSHLCRVLSKNSDFHLLGSSDTKEELTELLTASLDMVIDFTTPDSVYENTLAIINGNIRPIIGTTGLSSTQIQTLQELCAKKNLGGIIAPNFSLGSILMMKCSKLVAKHLTNVEIIEYHHPQKIDTPSGTAIKTAEIISNATTHSADNIPIHSVRLPGVLASQDVIFGGLGETLTISHKTIDRECFMPGILLACKKSLELNELMYGLEDLLD